MTIRLDLDASKVCTIILPWGQYTPTRANNGNDREVLQRITLLELMESQEEVWAHLDDLLCISWGSLEDQIDCS